jgi:Zn finger protein HypA/HybF involved in hydrogenase expression
MSKRKNKRSKFTKDPFIIQLMKEEGFKFFECPACKQEAASTHKEKLLCPKCKIPLDELLPPTV